MRRDAALAALIACGCGGGNAGREPVVAAPVLTTPAPAGAPELPPEPAARVVDLGELADEPRDVWSPEADLRRELFQALRTMNAQCGTENLAVTIYATVGVEGEVVEARVEGSHPRAAGCLQNELVGWRFSRHGDPVHVRATFRVGNLPPFDRGAAAAALASVDVRSCSVPGGPTGAGHLTVTFAASGTVLDTRVDQPPFAGTAVGACVEKLFRAIRVPAFDQPTLKIGKSFVVP